ncbi:MAG TPA: hypothetical protein VM734_21550, partial [Kofleriaceae bacterium]|nr:hypothetical protein [Kofleriaceae bacterium]
MMHPSLPSARRVALAALGLATGLAACGGGDDDDGGGTGPLTGPVFVVANEVYTDDSSTTYVNVLDSLDIDQVDYTKAIEIAGGRATIATTNGWLFVAPPDEPVIIRYEIDGARKLVETGRVSFANYGLDAIWVDEWGNTFISPTKAYLTNSDDGTALVWNPTTMEITGEIAPLQDLVRAGTTINSSPSVVRGDRLYRAIFWSNWQAWETSTEQYVAVYDTTTDRMIDLVPESRCPGLSNRVARDEAGNLYFSNWVHNVSETLVRGAPKSCAVRISAGADRPDADWTLPYADVTDGREAAMFSYIGDGKAMLNVFHDERATYDENTDPSALIGTANWRLWNIDPVAKTGAPVEGLDWMAGG